MSPDSWPTRSISRLGNDYVDLELFHQHMGHTLLADGCNGVDSLWLFLSSETSIMNMDNHLQLDFVDQL